MIQEEQMEGNLIKFSSSVLGFFPSLWAGSGEGA